MILVKKSARRLGAKSTCESLPRAYADYPGSARAERPYSTAVFRCGNVLDAGCPARLGTEVIRPRIAGRGKDDTCVSVGRGSSWLRAPPLRSPGASWPCR